jgi:acyl dehydratase
MSATTTVGWDDLAEGMGPEPREYGPLTRTDFVRYQGASGDFNPIHHDEEFAKSAGFPTVFSVGMLQAGILGTYCTDWLGSENVRRFSVQFREQVWPRDHLACSATVARKYEEDGVRMVDLDLLVTRKESGGAAIKGEATFVVA